MTTQTLNIALCLQAERNSDGQTDDLITRCPRLTFHARGIKTLKTEDLLLAGDIKLKQSSVLCPVRSPLHEICIKSEIYFY